MEKTKKTPVKTTKTTAKKTTTKATTKTIKTKPIPSIKVLTKKKIVFFASECAPFIATGGLADVVGSLPKALAENKYNDVSVIIPLYSNIKEEFRSKFNFVTSFNVSVGWRWQYAGVFFYEYQGVKYYFIDNEYYFKRDGNIYGFYDDGERFAFFSRAALDTLANLNIYPDVLHLNDWQTAASVIYLKGMYYADKNYSKIKTVFTIHNIEYQGVYSMDTFTELFGFSENIRNFVEFNGALNLMKGAIEMTDVLSTVSPSYANEIKHSLLCVKQETLELFGAVSPQTAREMATGARMLFNADIAVSVTGIAGPDGGSAEKPVGLVYVCISSKNTEKVYRLMASDKNGRCGVRRTVVQQVGRLLTELLENE